MNKCKCNAPFVIVNNHEDSPLETLEMIDGHTKEKVKVEMVVCKQKCAKCGQVSLGRFPKD